jgi:hypothetical protein
VVALSTLYSFTVGFVIEEQATILAQAERDPKYELAHRNARIDKDKHPLAYAAGSAMFTDYDEGFLDGVNLIIAGIAAMQSLSPAV